MRAAMYHGPGQPITIDTLADPNPGRGDLLVKVHRCGICGSDMSLTGDGPGYLPPGRFGHEWAGEVIEVGRDVEGYKPGDHISGMPVGPCGDCDACRAGTLLYCKNARPGLFTVGAFADYMVIPPGAANLLPTRMSWADGALVEPMACGLHALRLANMQRGETVLVFGAGGMSLSVVYWARLLGASKIVVLSRSAHRNDSAMALGADAVLGFDEEGKRKAVELLGGPPGIIAEGVGKVGMLGMAVEMIRPMGAVLSLGMCMHGDPVSPAMCVAKEVRLLFPHAYTIDEIAETSRAFDSGKVSPELMVSDVIALEALPGMMDAMRSGRKGLKVHVDPAL